MVFLIVQGFVNPGVNPSSLLANLERFFECGSSVENRALLDARACEDRQLVNALAHFALQLREYRISRKMVSAPLF